MKKCRVKQPDFLGFPAAAQVLCTSSNLTLYVWGAKHMACGPDPGHGASLDLDNSPPDCGVCCFSCQSHRISTSPESRLILLQLEQLPPSPTFPAPFPHLLATVWGIFSSCWWLRSAAGAKGGGELQVVATLNPWVLELRQQQFQQACGLMSLLLDIKPHGLGLNDGHESSGPHKAEPNDFNTPALSEYRISF